MRVSVKQIGEKANVSSSTVSNVLNGKKGVNAKTAERVRKIAEELGYAVAAHIDSITLIMYKKSGKILTDTPLIEMLIDGAEREASRNDYKLVLQTITKGAADFSEKMHGLTQAHNSAFILLATEMDWVDIEPFSHLKAPLVVVDAWFPEGNFDTVLMNNFDSMYLSTQHLIKNGHRNIGYLSGSPVIRNFQERQRGFCFAMEEHGLRLTEEHFISLGGTTSEAYEDMKKYLCSMPQLPTAFCADNDIVAIGAMRALQDYGYRIPEDISIIGFDNMPFCEVVAPGLTSRNVLKSEMGQIAVHRLIEQIQTNACHVRTEIPTTLIERNSIRQL